MRVKVNQIVAEGDLVSVYWTASGTNTAAGAGMPATGKSVSIGGMTLFRFERGLIQEEWSVFNDVLDHEAARPAPDDGRRTSVDRDRSTRPCRPGCSTPFSRATLPFTTTTSKPSANLNGST